MFELTIKGTVYPFSFGVGFMREIDKTATATENGITKNIGFNLLVASLHDHNAVDLIDALDIANKMAGNPRVSRAKLDAYIDDECTDIAALCEEILGFFENGNATKERALAVREIIEQAKAQK